MSLGQKAGPRPPSLMPNLFLVLFCRQIRSLHDLLNSLLFVLILSAWFTSLFLSILINAIIFILDPSSLGYYKTFYHVKKQVVVKGKWDTECKRDFKAALLSCAKGIKRGKGTEDITCLPEAALKN